MYITRRGPEARAPRWPQWNPNLLPILSVQVVHHPASAADIPLPPTACGGRLEQEESDESELSEQPQSPRLRGERGIQMLAHQDPPFSRTGLV